MNSTARHLRVLFITVPSMFMVVTLVVPALDGLALSLDSGGPSLTHYRVIAGDAMFWRALANNLIVPLGSLAVELAMGLGLALAMSARRSRWGAVEIAAILPFAIPEIVLLTLARYLFMPRGYINAALEVMSVRSLGWLVPGSPLALATVIIVDAWHVTPVVMLILMAGLQTIPIQLYEAAQLDGAGTLATFWYVTLPLLTPAMSAALILRGVDSLRIFATTLVLTGPEGVPVLSTYAYQLWSDARAPREAMAASVVLALMVTILGLGATVAARHWTETRS